MSEDSKPLDENGKLVAGRLPADPMADAKPANQSAARVVGLRNARPRVVLVKEVFTRIVDDAKQVRPAQGISFGHFKLDKWMGGLRRKHITLVGACTSFGKTSKALHVADIALRGRKNVLFISGEDSDLLCGKRLMAMRARVNALRLRDNACTKQEITQMEKALLQAEHQPFFMDAIGAPVEDVVAEIREQTRIRTIDLVIVDYLQCLSVRRRSQDRRNEVTYIAKTLSDAIKNIDATGLLISQLRRPEGNNPNRPPTMFDLKESGDLENAAEHVLLGYVEDVVDPVTGITTRRRKIKLGKNKDGPAVDQWLDLPFDETTASFRDVGGQPFEGDAADGEVPP